MKVGDLVKYINHNNLRVGIVIKVIDKFHRDDNVLVQWDKGKAWHVEPSWIEVINESR
jgi:hypothetical protein